MGRSRGAPWAALLGACLICGCGMTAGQRTPSLLSAFRTPDKPSENAAAEPNPLKQTRQDATTQPVKTADAAIESNASDAAQAESDIKLVSHDAETLQLIDQELRYIPPEDRGQLYEDLKTLDPSMVRIVLRNMRLMRESGQRSTVRQIATGSAHDAPSRPGSGDQNARQTAKSSVHHENYASPQPEYQSSAAPTLENGRRSQAFRAVGSGAQLGAANPWNQYSADLAGASRQSSQSSPVSNGHGYEHHGPGAGHEPAGAAMQVLPGQPDSQYQHLEQIAASRAQSFGHSAMYSRDSMNGADDNAVVPTAASGARTGDPRQRQNQAAQVATQPASLQPPGLPVPPGADPHPPAGRDVATRRDAAIAGTSRQRTMSERFGVPPINSSRDVSASKWYEELHRLISIAEAEAAQMSIGTTEEEKQQYLQKQAYLRMLYLMGGQQERALEAIPGLDAADQEFWQQMFWAVANYFDYEAMPYADDRATQTVAQLRSAVHRLQENAKLELSNVVFCHKIASFGNYERFDRDEFSPGQPVLVYAEADNFKSEPTADGQFRTILRSTIEIYKAGSNGDLVERYSFPATEDLCRNHRRDYFHSYEFSIPQRISLGPHVLKLTVEDQLSQKVATYSLNFTVK